MRNATLLLFVTFLTAGTASAKPYEFYGCSFNEGFGMADFEQWIEKWEKVQGNLEGPYTAVILTPQYASRPDIPDFYWMGSWPDAAAMGSGLKQYFEDGAGAAVDADVQKIVTCRAALWWGRTIFER